MDTKPTDGDYDDLATGSKKNKRTNSNNVVVVVVVIHLFRRRPLLPQFAPSTKLKKLVLVLVFLLVLVSKRNETHK